MKKIRTRFAPSPTGPLHIGGVRTALYCYLFAKKNNGDFILRIEDTDQTRYVKDAEDYILRSLEWCSIIPDESPKHRGNYAPYRQSERKDIYKKYVLELVERGFAYYAFDTSEKLDQIRKQYEQNKEIFIYNNKVRNSLDNSLNISKEQLEQRLKKQEKYVIRFKMPNNREVFFEDIIRGSVKYNTDVLDDKILFKSDGMPTYHLANVVDDYLMEISHVIRGEEWIPSTPLHVLLYEAFGWEKPKFAHLPLILKPEGKGKLSKRDGDKHGFPVFPLDWKDENGNIFMGYKEQGYYPEAFINMLALLGWNNSTDQELFSIKELIREFSLEKVSKSGAKFDIEKTKWFNQQYLRNKDDEYICEELEHVLKKNNIIVDRKVLLKIIKLVKDRVNFVRDIFTENRYFFEVPTNYSDITIKKIGEEDMRDNLKNIYKIIDSERIEDIKSEILNFIKERGSNLGKVMKIIRFSIVGDLKGPDIFEIIDILGKENVLNRINNFILFLN